jgi:uncharacterized coiled-coil protein SlyX
MTDSIYTIAMLTVASGMTIIAGISAYLYRQRDGQFEAAAKRCNELAGENDQYETALATSEATVKGLKETQAQLERIIHKTSAQLDHLSAERANLYFRNAKGQIEPINPKPRKPHTLKHSMTVKDPTEVQAKRIFREAKKAGLETGAMITDYYNDVFYTIDDCGFVSACKSLSDKTNYITTTEFIRRIRGEQE